MVIKLRKVNESWSAFSLIELLIVIGVIAILSTLLLPYISSLTGSAQEGVARQQQVQLQTALGNWISDASSGPGGLAAARTAYSGTGSKLGLLQDYLHPTTYANLQGSGGTVTSSALTASGASLQFSSWSIDASPSVNWSN